MIKNKNYSFQDEKIFYTFLDMINNTFFTIVFVWLELTHEYVYDKKKIRNFITYCKQNYTMYRACTGI